jgi:hypothetical protein
VILAVSLALIAVLVATGAAPRDGAPHTPRLADTAAGDASKTPRGRPGAAHHTPTGPGSTTTTTVATSTQSPPKATTTVPLLSTGTEQPPIGNPSGLTTTTTTPSTPATTTTTTTAVAVGSGNVQPSDRTQQTGVMVPPGSMSHGYAFTGTGAMQLSVVWSGATYLTMVVSCPSGSQSVGGTSAMAANLTDATGSCMATVTEPSSESVALSYTISWGPAGG